MLKDNYALGKKYDADIVRFKRKRVKTNSKGKREIDVNFIPSGIHSFVGDEISMFVEQVDFDYSLKLYNAGYMLAKLHDIYFEHHEAEPTKKNGRVLWNYSPVRFYYIGRNHIYMRKKYGEQFTNYNLGTVAQYFEFYDKAIHEQQPLKKVVALTLGIIDAATNHYGKCKWKFI